MALSVQKIPREFNVEISVRGPVLPVHPASKVQIIYFGVFSGIQTPAPQPRVIAEPKPHKIVPVDFLEKIESLDPLIYRATFGDYDALLELIQRKFKYINGVTFYFMRHPQAVARLKESIRLTGNVMPLQLLRRINREVKRVPNLSTLENVRHHVKTRLNRRMYAAQRGESQQPAQHQRQGHNSSQVQLE